MDLEVSEETLVSLQGDLIPKLKLQLSETEAMDGEEQKGDIEEPELEIMLENNSMAFPERFVVVVVPAAEDLYDSGEPTKYYVFVYQELDNDEDEKRDGYDYYANEDVGIQKRGVLLRIRRRVLKKSYLYNRLNQKLVGLNTKMKQLEHTIHGLKRSHGSRMLSQMAALMTVAKSAGLRMMLLPAMLVSTNNVVSTQHSNDIDKEKDVVFEAFAADSNSVIYAFQRLDGDEHYRLADSEVLKPKHRVFEDGAIKEKLSIETEPNKGVGIAAEEEVKQEPKEHINDDKEKVPDSAQESETEEECTPVTWYSIFHHSVFGTPKLCQL